MCPVSAPPSPIVYYHLSLSRWTEEVDRVWLQHRHHLRSVQAWLSWRNFLMFVEKQRRRFFPPLSRHHRHRVTAQQIMRYTHTHTLSLSPVTADNKNLGACAATTTGRNTKGRIGDISMNAAAKEWLQLESVWCLGALWAVRIQVTLLYWLPGTCHDVWRRGRGRDGEKKRKEKMREGKSKEGWECGIWIQC